MWGWFRGRVFPSVRAGFSGSHLCRRLATMSWQPATPLADGLARTIAYFDKLLSEAANRASSINTALAATERFATWAINSCQRTP